MTTRTLAIISVSAVIAISIIIGGASAALEFQTMSDGYEGACRDAAEYRDQPNDGYESQAEYLRRVARWEDRVQECRTVSALVGIRNGAIAFFVGGAVVLLALRRGGQRV